MLNVVQNSTVTGQAENPLVNSYSVVDTTIGDLRGWNYSDVVLLALDRENQHFKCPNLFPLHGKGVMIGQRAGEFQSNEWSGVITMPRILSISPDGFLRQRRIPEFESLRQPPITFPAQSLDRPTVIEGVSTDCAEIEATFSGGGTSGLQLRRAEDGTTGIVVSLQAQFLWGESDRWGCTCIPGFGEAVQIARVS